MSSASQFWAREFHKVSSGFTCNPSNCGCCQSRWGVPGRHTRYGVSFGFTAVVEASLSGTSDIICQKEWARNMAIG